MNHEVNATGKDWPDLANETYGMFFVGNGNLRNANNEIENRPCLIGDNQSEFVVEYKLAKGRDNLDTTNLHL